MKRKLGSQCRKEPSSKQVTKPRRLKGLLKKLECSLVNQSEGGALIVPGSTQHFQRRIIE